MSGDIAIRAFNYLTSHFHCWLPCPDLHNESRLQRDVRCERRYLHWPECVNTIATQGGDGFGDTAIGEEALFTDMVGCHNTAVGHRTLASNTTGNDNCAIGTGRWKTIIVTEMPPSVIALRFNVKGHDNSALGSNALAYDNADHNVAVE
ncbi:MAG TPA: hypothetical protein VGI60_12540 [Chthoniobacterales bacterium]|jgi:hypothetical protein